MSLVTLRSADLHHTVAGCGLHLMRDVQEADEALEMARGLIQLSSGETGPEKRRPVPREFGLLAR